VTVACCHHRWYVDTGPRTQIRISSSTATLLRRVSPLTDIDSVLVSLEGMDFMVALRDNGRCEGLRYGDTHVRPRSRIAVLADSHTTQAVGTSAGCP